MEGSLCLNQDTISLINKGCTYFSLTESVPTCFLVFCSLNGKAVTSPEVFMWICYQSVMVQNVEVGFFQAMVTSINQPCSVTKWFSSDWNFLVPDYLSVFHPLWYPWVPFVHVPILAIFLLLIPLNFCCFKPPSCILLSTSRKVIEYMVVVAKSRPTLQPCGLPGSSVHGISQARILEWVAISFFRDSSQPRMKLLSPAVGRLCTAEPRREAQQSVYVTCVFVASHL